MLTLIIGGRESGKYDYLIEQGYCHSDIGESFDNKVLYKLNEVVKSLLAKDIDPVEYIKSQIANGCITTTIVCDEVGCGIVPMDKFEREYREVVGRICTMIAKQADTVIRIYCGIATTIKG